MTQDERISRALLDPAAEFETPNDVLISSSLSEAQKIEILRRWEYDASEISVAEEEGMPHAKSVGIDQVLQALQKLVPHIDAGHSPPTKQGGLDRRALREKPTED
ncbi:hypothetical protein [Roseovarius arcticus]|uniref:hypothetical protein n=1 Tax=Roseovarius arcticus TaxID=2547404 RepID=UPI001110B15A|nr:hypothetical protein [Roseovarius arcticus]